MPKAGFHYHRSIRTVSIHTIINASIVYIFLVLVQLSVWSGSCNMSFRTEYAQTSQTQH